MEANGRFPNNSPAPRLNSLPEQKKQSQAPQNGRSEQPVPCSWVKWFSHPSCDAASIYEAIPRYLFAYS